MKWIVVSNKPPSNLSPSNWLTSVHSEKSINFDVIAVILTFLAVYKCVQRVQKSFPAKIRLFICHLAVYKQHIKTLRTMKAKVMSCPKR